MKLLLSVSATLFMSVLSQQAQALHMYVAVGQMECSETGSSYVVGQTIGQPSWRNYSIDLNACKKLKEAMGGCIGNYEAEVEMTKEDKITQFHRGEWAPGMKICR